MPGSYAICRLDADVSPPTWATRSMFFSIYLFVRDTDLNRAVAALRDAGHTVALDA